jgi:hypothetical protein
VEFDHLVYNSDKRMKASVTETGPLRFRCRAASVVYYVLSGLLCFWIRGVGWSLSLLPLWIIVYTDVCACTAISVCEFWRRLGLKDCDAVQLCGRIRFRGPCRLHPRGDGSSMDLRNVSILPQHCTASQTRRPRLEAILICLIGINLQWTCKVSFLIDWSLRGVP